MHEVTTEPFTELRFSGAGSVEDERLEWLALKCQVDFLGRHRGR